MRGIKTATCSAYDLYEIEGEPIPEAGEYSVILDSKDEAVCIIRTTKVTVIPFNAVSEEHAFKEGEGDRSLEYWREVHESFLSRELASVRLEFNEETKVVCEDVNAGDIKADENVVFFSKVDPDSSVGKVSIDDIYDAPDGFYFATEG